MTGALSTSGPPRSALRPAQRGVGVGGLRSGHFSDTMRPWGVPTTEGKSHAHVFMSLTAGIVVKCQLKEKGPIPVYQ